MAEYYIDYFILDSVTQYKIEFAAGFPQQESVPREICFSLQEQHIIQNEIDKLLEKGVIKETTHCEGEYISTIFIHPKKDGTYRLILNLKNLNEHVEYHHFKMDTLQSAIRLMTQNCYIASVDLRDAYYSFPLMRNIKSSLDSAGEENCFSSPVYLMDFPVPHACLQKY